MCHESSVETMDDTNGTSVSITAVPVGRDEGAVQNNERIGVAITERMKESIRRFLDTQSAHSSGLTVDFVKSIRWVIGIPINHFLPITMKFNLFNFALNISP